MKKFIMIVVLGILLSACEDSVASLQSELKYAEKRMVQGYPNDKGYFDQLAYIKNIKYRLREARKKNN